MTIEKSMFSPPAGAAAADFASSADSADSLPADAVEITIVPDDDPLEAPLPELEATCECDFAGNLAEQMDERDLAELAGELITAYEEDTSSRKDWIQTYVDGLELLGLKIEDRTEPWDGACGVYHPLLAEALVKFQSETMMATFPAAGPVRTKIIGRETPEKKEAAARVQEDMNYQLTEVMPEFRPEHERMLWGLGLSGNAFKKVYYDPNLDRQVSAFVPAEDIVVPYGASDLRSAERITHVMRKTENEVARLQYGGFYRDVDLGAPASVIDDVEKRIAEKMGFRATTDDRFKLLEMHVHLDLKGFEHKDPDTGGLTGIALPYVVTIEKGTGEVLAIRRNWVDGDDTYQARQHFVHYPYIPGFGFYAFGLIHLIGAFAKSGTSLIRQLVDAGTLSNLPGGFKSRGLRVKGDDTPIAPGEWRDVDVPSGSIRDNLLPLPYKEPSQVLAGLMDKIVEEGRRFANTADLQISDMSAQAPVGTTLAILERTLKNMSAIQARIHFAMKQELGLLKAIIADFAPPAYAYDPDSGDRFARQEDYADVDVIPVSDPNAATMAQKIVQMQAVFQMAQQSPQLFNMPLLNRQMLEIMGVKDADKLVPMEEDMRPQDPVTENQAIISGKPVKAFLLQDHQSHIAVHMAAMQDPKIQQLLQGSPMAQAMQAAAMAHLSDHVGFLYRRQMEEQLGMAMPPMEDENGEKNYLDPQVEANLSPMLAQAAQQLLQKNAQQVQQAQAQQQMQDPLVQLQMQEVQTKQAEQQRKAQKDKIDAQFRAQQLQLEAQRIAQQGQLDQQKLYAQVGQSMTTTSAEREKLMASLSVDVLKHLSDKSAQSADRNARGAEAKVGNLTQLARDAEKHRASGQQQMEQHNAQRNQQLVQHAAQLHQAAAAPLKGTQR